jgi:hypothetical protein
MNLPRKEADLFYELMWGLQFFVNQQLKILSEILSLEEYIALPPQKKIDVRDRLWAKTSIIDDYVSQNPSGLRADDLAIVRKWKGFVSGTFQILRYLKKHTIFISENSTVYAVLSLHDPFQEMFRGQPTPINVDAVLLPFKGHIVYDGMLKLYPIFWGKNVRAELNDTYMRAKQNGHIVTTLESDQVAPTRSQPKPKRDWSPMAEEVVRVSEKMRGGDAVENAALGLLRTSARLAEAVAKGSRDLYEMRQLGHAVWKALKRVDTSLKRSQP